MKRLILFTVTISLLLLLNTYYYLYYELHKEYPGNEDIIEGFEGKVSIYGVVINKSYDGFYILIEHGPKNKAVKVLSDLDVENGDRVEVLGLLQKDEIIPEKIIVYKKWSYYSIFIRSVIAIPIVVFIFFKYWRFDFRQKRFRRRKNA
ncbi:hypothetical protein Asulf_00057 [Archaeoglobus sulfaticallidus PM70-1]|uniref:Uncharacterized protein n=1 Tax=Archaeoglobus sulfaticallidus PM70-1 TaxID=387631 RepID=N0BAS2_9EURY|nr:hypothetical protein [Archaeoglobus sulfaticallidus]AGK60093.1 hypothetical protein Asulf_00057 [Archaeoglobus sulfaticallidus PM70-1]